MEAKVKESWPYGIVRAFSGREYVKYEWRRIPAGGGEEAARLEAAGLLTLRGKASPPAPEPQLETEPVTEPETQPEPEPQPEPEMEPEPEPEPDATAGAVDLAMEHGIDLSLIEGTGVDGRILVADVRAFIDESEAG